MYGALNMSSFLLSSHQTGESGDDATSMVSQGASPVWCVCGGCEVSAIGSLRKSLSSSSQECEESQVCDGHPDQSELLHWALWESQLDELPHDCEPQLVECLVE